MPKPRTRPFIRAVLIDVSGTLHVGNSPTPNAVEAFHRLRCSGIPFRLCSNTSKESTTSLVRRLEKLGFDMGPSSGLSKSEITLDLASDMKNRNDQQHHRQGRREVWTSIGAVAQYIRNQQLKRPYFLLSSSAKEEIISSQSSNGLGPLEDSDDSPYDSVVVGLAPEVFDYAHLNTAFRILKGELETQKKTKAGNRPLRKDVSDGHGGLPFRPQLIATHKARYIQTEAPAGLSLGPGPFVTALETAANVEAHTVGKPTRLFFQTVIDDFYASGELSQTERHGRIAVVGDDVETDLGDGAVEMGLWRILVKTGKYRSGDESRPGITPPDEVQDSFSTFVEVLLREQQRNACSHKL